MPIVTTKDIVVNRSMHNIKFSFKEALRICVKTYVIEFITIPGK